MGSRPCKSAPRTLQLQAAQQQRTRMTHALASMPTASGRRVRAFHAWPILSPSSNPLATTACVERCCQQVQHQPLCSHQLLLLCPLLHAAGWKALLRLASQAALVVTEDMPVPPDADWLQARRGWLCSSYVQRALCARSGPSADASALLLPPTSPPPPPPLLLQSACSLPSTGCIVQFLQALAEDLPATIPIAAVDTACVLPMRLVRKFHERAYTFRSATEAQRRQRLKTYAPPPAALLGPAAVAPAALQGLPPLPQGATEPGQLGWQPLELAGIPALHLQQRLRQVLQACPALDHSVPGVGHLPGGSMAGYVRWEAFRK